MHCLCRCRAYGYVQPIRASHFFREDPKNTSSGSVGTPPARSGPEKQDVAVLPLEMTLYVAPLPCPVTGHSPP